MNRYQYIDILKDNNGKRFYSTVLYPQINPQLSDIYIIAKVGDKMEFLADFYYSDSSLWWIISGANNIPKDSIYAPPGTQLRIPTNISNIIEEFRTLNNNR